MIRILMLDRSDLVGDKKLSRTADINISDFMELVRKAIELSDICVFQCRITDTQMVIKSRCEDIDGEVTSIDERIGSIIIPASLYPNILK